MKVVAAYLLAVLGGSASPSADVVKDILSSGIYLPAFSFWSFFCCL